MTIAAPAPASIGSLFDGIRLAPKLLARHWPALMAWFVAGSVVRLGIILAAAPLSRDQPVVAMLFLPLAVLARLVSFVAMFLTVRPSLPGYRAVRGHGEPVGWRQRSIEFLDALVPAVAPFFLVYGLVGGVEDDLTSYAREAYRYSFGSANGDGIDIGSGPVVVAIIVIAFLARQALARLGDRLPEWLVFAEIYFEATWSFVAVAGIANVFGGVVSWVQDREVVAFLTDTREWLVSAWHGFDVALDGLGGLIPLATTYVIQPVLWILVGVLVYAPSLKRLEEHRVVPHRTEGHARARLAVMPRWLARSVRALGRDWGEIYKPLTIGVQMLRAVGLPALAVGLAAYGVMQAIQLWSMRGAVLLVGSHDTYFWANAVGIFNIVASTVFEPIRIALLAAIFDQLLRAWVRRHPARHASPHAPRPASPPAPSGAAQPEPRSE